MDLTGVSLGHGAVIPFAERVLSLWVVLDGTLSWKPHFDKLTSKVNRVLYSLRFFRSCTTELIRRRLVQFLILWLLDYCSTVTLDATCEQKIKLQWLQNSCARYIYGIKRRDHVTPYRRRLGWLRTNTRRQYTTAVLLYKIINFRASSYLYVMFDKCQQSRPARSGDRDLKVPKVHTEYGNGSFRAQGMRLWNSLPEHIKYLPTLNRFKTALYDYFYTLE